MARILFVCLLSALLPLLGHTSAQLLAGRAGQGDQAELATAMGQTLCEQGQRELEGRAAALTARLGSTAAGVRQLSSYAQEVLRSPEVYGNFHRKPATTGAAPATPSGAKPPADTSVMAPPDPGQAVESTLYYVTGRDGALRKALDDKESAVFFQARTGGVPFSQFDMNRVFATATLDPLLKATVTTEPLVTTAYLITSDNLIRCYPFVDTSGWAAERDFTGLAMYAFSPKKANEDGVVWTSPYVSQFTKEWVVACLSGVKLGSEQLAVAGAELSLARLAEQGLGFSFGSDAACWLQTGDGLVLAAQPGADALLRVIPMGSAALPTEKHSDTRLKSEANLAESGAKEVADALAAAGSGASQLTPLSAAEADGKFVGWAALDGIDWKLCGLATYSALAEIESGADAQRKAAAAQLPLTLGLTALGLVLGLLLSFVEARRLSQPLQILTQRLRRSLASRSAMPVAIAEEGEIGGLAAACQDLVDTAFAPGGEPPSPPQ